MDDNVLSDKVFFMQLSTTDIEENPLCFPQDKNGLILFQENETLKFLIDCFNEKVRRKQDHISIIFSGSNDRNNFYHVFVCMYKNIHPEMKLPIILNLV
jgi:hypothetical protein